MSGFSETFSYKLIYVFRINDKTHNGLLKIGDATVKTTKSVNDLFPNCHDLKSAAKERIDSYTRTASIPYELLYTELAIKSVVEHGVKKLEAFRDKNVHNVLTRSGIKKHEFHIDNEGTEWFETDLETAKKAIVAVKNNQSSLNPDDISEDNSPIIFRPEQKNAINSTIKQFKKSDRMLWNAKMRFGKTLTALEVAKEMQFHRTLIFTHRPVVSDGWFKDFTKIFKGTDYKYGSKSMGEKIEDLFDGAEPFVYFASMQDLRGSAAVGGKFDKNEFIFLIDWDFVIVDEAHEGTQTTLGQRVIETIISNNLKTPKLLELSGTPFNLLRDFTESEIYTWDYIMEQKAKHDWALNHFGDSNPYDELPRLEIFTYNLDKVIPGYIDVEDSAFNFREFFRTWTGNVQKDFKPMPDGVKIGDFVHLNDIKAFLNLIVKLDGKSNYPFATETYRSYYRHTLWMVPGVKEAKALSKLLQSHPVFGQFKIVNVAGEGDEEEKSDDALAAVRKAIGNHPDDTYSITISCGRLTTGVTVPEWTAVLMLAGSSSTSASNYLQTIFRVQTPANINGKMKERCSVFDFAPDRTLKMVAEAGQLSTRVGKISDKIIMGEFLNYCPVVSIEGTNMKPFNVDGMLQQLKKVYSDRVVKNGFDDKHLYNENLLKLDKLELEDFEALKRIVGSSKQTKKLNEVDINHQGFTDEEYAELERIERKPKKELTPEEQTLLEQKKKQRENAQKAMSILRGISIRIPLLIYGADVPANQEITINNFIDIIDETSWQEFMPNKVTKDVYKKFAKYYDEDVFIAAGRKIRDMAKAADEFPPAERVMKIAGLFAMFKNPDKETVLTPWRVVNMHLGDCLGGYNFYNEDYTDTISEPRLINYGKVTIDTLANVKAKILEINSKTGLYPLYVTYSIYRQKLDKIPKEQQTFEKQREIWRKTVENNVFVICKTPMAKMITKRTLLGYQNGKINAHAFDDLINQFKSKSQQFIEKITRGSFWNKEENEMKFDAIVGNPPYQIIDGGNGSSSISIYNLFVESGIAIQPSYVSMIIPSRWFSGGKGLDNFRKMMLENKNIRVLHDYMNSAECFTNASIEGGVCYFLWDKLNQGLCKYTSHQDNDIQHSERYLKQNDKIDVLIRDEKQLRILNKILDKTNNFFSKIVFPRNPFGLNDNIEQYFVGNNKSQYSVLARINNKRVIKFVDNNVKISKNKVLLSKYKIFVSKADGAAGQIGNPIPAKVLGKPEFGDVNQFCTQTFLVIGPFESSTETKNVMHYMQTKFFRFMVGLRKNKNMTQETYAYVPLVDFNKKWSDKELYDMFGLDEHDIDYIEKMIKPME